MGAGGSAKSKVREMPEEEMMQLFRTYDTDNNGIDEMELGPMLEDLGFLNGTPEENVQMLQRLFTEILPQVDDNHDERLQYDEFRRFVLLACELDVGKKKKGKVIKGRDAKALDTSTEALRKQKEEERLRRRAEQAAELARHNKEMKARLKEAKKQGRDAKKESAEATAARKQKEQERLESIRSRRTDMRQREKELENTKKTTAVRIEAHLDEDAEAGRAEVARRAQEAKDKNDKEIAQHAKDLTDRNKNTSGRIDAKLSAEAEALREQVQKEHADKKAQEAKEIAQHAKDLKEMTGGVTTGRDEKSLSTETEQRRAELAASPRTPGR